ncbi:MAG: hypothetical protein JRI68_10855 [Deltaproteobacteria bacterium]|nr:hypothetical protein [Deltaproteobacteria bacterium]
MLAKRLAWSLAVVAAGAGCAASGFDGAVYHGDGFSFRIPPPPTSWSRLDASNAALAFRDEANRGTIMIHGRCGLDGDDVPLAALTAHLFLQFTEREIETQEIVPFDGREAMHTVLDAKLDGVAMRYDVWVLKKDGCVYDLLYLAPKASFAGGRASFEALVRGFATVKPSGH